MINREVIESILPHEQASKLVQSDEDKLSVAIERPPNLPGNQLGLTSIDLNELNPLQAILV